VVWRDREHDKTCRLSHAIGDHHCRSDVRSSNFGCASLSTIQRMLFMYCPTWTLSIFFCKALMMVRAAGFGPCRFAYSAYVSGSLDFLSLAYSASIRGSASLKRAAAMTFCFCIDSGLRSSREMTKRDQGRLLSLATI
jgi:hypothetical protein